MVTTQLLQHEDDSHSKAMSVNVALCGSIPRAHLTQAPLWDGPQNRNSRYGNGLTVSCEKPHNNNENVRPPSHGPAFEAPTWAVPAPGEARLEVCCL